MEVTQIGLGQKDGDLAAENSKGEFLPVKVRNGTDEAKAIFLPQIQFFMKGVRQESVYPLDKFVANLVAGDESSQFGFPGLAKFHHAFKCLRATGRGQLQAGVH